MKRLRRTAMTLPKPLVRKCLLSMKKRIEMTRDAEGEHISID